VWLPPIVLPAPKRLTMFCDPTGSAFVHGCIHIHLPGGGTSTGGNRDATVHRVFRVEGIDP